MKNYQWLLLAILMSQGNLFAGELEVRLDPELAGKTNLLANGHWQFGKKYDSLRLEAFQPKRDKQTYFSSPDSLYIKPASIKYSGYWEQFVPVEAGKTYFVFSRFKASNARILIWMSGRAGKIWFDERMYYLKGKPSFLVPVFLKPSYTQADQMLTPQWQSLARSITIPRGMSKLRFDIGSYFGAGEIWFDDVTLCESVPPLRLHMVGARRDDHVTVQMKSTRDVIFQHILKTGEERFTALVPDTVADQSYIVKVSRQDKIFTWHYPCKDQQTIRR